MSEPNSEKVVSVSARGQATIPKEFREELGIDAPGRVKFVRTEDGEIVVRPIRSVTDLRGVLGGRTDEDGRSALDVLREGRERDEEREDGLREEFLDDDADAAVDTEVAGDTDEADEGAGAADGADGDR